MTYFQKQILHFKKLIPRLQETVKSIMIFDSNQLPFTLKFPFHPDVICSANWINIVFATT